MSTWIKLHNNFFRNPKVLAAGEDAALLYIQGLVYCSDSLTDGSIPTAALRTLTSKKDARTLARVLVREGLWIETASGWQVHDYLKVQRSREQVEASREAARERQRKSRSVTPTSQRESQRDIERTSGDVTEPDTETDVDTEQPPQPPLLDRIVDIVFEKVLADKQRRGEGIASVSGYRSWWDEHEAEGCRKRAAWVLENFEMPSLSHYADATRSPSMPTWAVSMMREKESA